MTQEPRSLTPYEAANLRLSRFRHPWTVEFVSIVNNDGRIGVSAPAFDSAWSNLWLAIERWRASGAFRAVVRDEVGGERYELPEDLPAVFIRARTLGRRLVREGN